MAAFGANPSVDRSTLETTMNGASEAKISNIEDRADLSLYRGYLARLLVLGATFGAGWLLHHISSGKPYFGFLVLTGVILVCVGLVMGPNSQRTSTQAAVPLFDLAWITFAMYLTDGLSSFLLPMLYVVVATVAVRGNRWEIGTSVAGAITGIFILASTHATGPNLTMAVAQSALLAAGALAVRLTAVNCLCQTERSQSEALYAALLQTTSNAVLTLAPDDWRIMEANPAARNLFDGDPGHSIENQPLDKVIQFRDHAFAVACRQSLARSEPVRDATTVVTLRDGSDATLRFNLIPALEDERLTSVQVVIEAAPEAPAAPAPAPARGDDFSVNYIPALTHELNNHLAAIRLSAELAATTGRTPDYQEIQQQVDHCQEVLQTVVLQILRASAPIHTPEKTPSSDLRTVIERCLLLTRPQILSFGIQLQVSAPDHLPPIAGFAHELQEALVRVMIHSVKTMSSQEPPRMLSLVVEEKPGEVELLISDSSEGLGHRELAIINGRSVASSRVEDRTWEIVRDAFCRFGGQANASIGLNGGTRLKLNLPLIREQVVAQA